jgi:hypothetical protein
MDYTMGADGILALSLSGGAPTMIAPGAGTFAMAVDQGNFYWIDFYDGNVYELSLATGERRVLAEGPGYATNSDLAFDVDAVYWLADQSVFKMAK